MHVKWQNIITSLPILGILFWSLFTFLSGWPRVTPSYFFDFVARMWPPDLSVLFGLVDPMFETIQIALTASILSSVSAMFLALLSARETTPHILCSLCARGIIVTTRAIPTLMWALLFVILLGLGPFTGTVALTVHCVGVLGRLFYEAIEAKVPTVTEILEAMRIDGANEIQVIWYGILPLLAPLFTSYILARLETNIRASTILGLVGVGGIGLKLTTSIRMFRSQECLTIILTIFGLVTATDVLSRAIRTRIIRWQ